MSEIGAGNAENYRVTPLGESDSHTFNDGEDYIGGVTEELKENLKASVLRQSTHKVSIHSSQKFHASQYARDSNMATRFDFHDERIAELEDKHVNTVTAL